MIRDLSKSQIPFWLSKSHNTRQSTKQVFHKRTQNFRIKLILAFPAIFSQKESKDLPPIFCHTQDAPDTAVKPQEISEDILLSSLVLAFRRLKIHLICL